MRFRQFFVKHWVLIVLLLIVDFLLFSIGVGLVVGHQQQSVTEYIQVIGITAHQQLTGAGAIDPLVVVRGVGALIALLLLMSIMTFVAFFAHKPFLSRMFRLSKAPLQDVVVNALLFVGILALSRLVYLVLRLLNVGFSVIGGEPSLLVERLIEVVFSSFFVALFAATQARLWRGTTFLAIWRKALAMWGIVFGVFLLAEFALFSFVGIFGSIIVAGIILLSALYAQLRLLDAT